MVENEFGALARIAGLFSGRGYNIESLTVAPTLDDRLSRMTINAIGNERVIEQIIKQLNRLISVVKVKDITAEDPIHRCFALIKINLGKRNRDKINTMIRPYGGVILEMDDKFSIIQVASEEEKLLQLVNELSPYGIMEFASSGTLAIQKGKRVFKAS